MDRPNESQLLAFARVMANLVAADEAFYEQGVKEFLGRRGKDEA